MAFVFTDSSTDVMSYGNIIDAPTNFSVMCSLKTATVTGGNYIVSKWDGGLKGWILQLKPTTKELRAVFNGNVVAVANTVVSNNTKYTIGMSYDGSNVQFYLNGDDGNPAMTATIVTNPTATLNIGDNDVASSVALGMTISNVFIWTSTLSLAEMTAWDAGIIVDPSNLAFWQPCWDKAAPDLIGQAASTEIGSVGTADDEHLHVPRYPRVSPPRSPIGILSLTKVISTDLQLADARFNLLGLLKVIDNNLSLQEAILRNDGFLKILADSLSILDGDNNDVFDPAGTVEETLSDGTVWKTVFPPFIKRTKWTNG